MKNFLATKKSFSENINFKKSTSIIPVIIFTLFSFLTIVLIETANNRIKIIDGMGDYKSLFQNTFFIFTILGSQIFLIRLLNKNSKDRLSFKFFPVILLGYYLLTPSITLLKEYSSTKYLMPILPHLQMDASMGINAFKSREIIPDGSKAVSTWAGTIPYFLPKVDFIDPLGKMDKYIARTKPRHPFWPGHTKWDWQYTLETYKPDFIFGIFKSECTDSYLHDCSDEELKNYEQLSLSPPLIKRKN